MSIQSVSLILLLHSSGAILQSYFKSLPNSHNGSVSHIEYFENIPQPSCAALSSRSADSYSFQYHSTSKQCGVHIGRFQTIISPDSDPNLRIFWKYHETCPENYTYYPKEKICIKYIPTEKLPSEASLFCEIDGGHLFIVNTNEKFNRLKQVLLSESVGENVYVFLGGGDLYSEGNFTWYDGSSYIPWSPGQPDNELGIEDCVGYKTYVDGIFDIQCLYPQSFLCEIPLLN